MTGAGGGSRSQRSVPEAGRGHLSEEEGQGRRTATVIWDPESQGGADHPQLPGIKGMEAGRQAARPQPQNCECDRLPEQRPRWRSHL